ncbi:RepB family protein [Lactococcus cremoris]|uniref:RepB family protein n=1 Tax=Lactococcus lactis subsp. cremoris TaxID=1359 RepID=UPI0021A9BF8D|nr:RepB family protein [Lactococcus cremoris]MCT4431346.1 RepB family protein [Lactococcus cremoris]
MSKNVKTIKELADELGTNKTRISRIINKNSIPTQKIKNKIVLEDNSVSLIRQYFKNETQLQNETVSILRTELDKAHSHIKKLSNLSDQQQRLALQDKKLLEEYKAENDSLKALKMPTEDTKEEQVNSQPKEEVKALKFEIRSLQEELNKQKIHSQEEREKLKAELTTPKKWYQFWK